MFYKDLGIISIALIWSAIIFIIKKWGSYRHKSISQHAIANKGAFISYTSIVFVALVLFALFIFKWFVPNFGFSDLFKVLAALSILGEFIAIGIPDMGGLKSRIHNAGAWGVGILLPVIVLLIATSSKIPRVVSYISIVAFICMLVLGYLFYINRKTHHNFLYFQSAYYASFHLVILSAVYIH